MKHGSPATLLVPALAVLLCSAGFHIAAQSIINDAISREISIFNFGDPSAPFEAISREVSVFNFGQDSAGVEAISREVSVLNFGQPAAGSEAISREVSVFNFGESSAGVEAVSREVSVFNFSEPSAGVEAVSREVSAFNFGQPSAAAEAISREVSVFNFGQPSAAIEAISREVSVFTSTNPVTDLAVTGVSAPAAARSGQPVQVIYTMTNGGPAAALGPWANQFILSADASMSNAVVAGTILFTNSVPKNGSVTLTQTVILPGGVSGPVFVGVTVNSDGELLETTRTNNTGFATVTTLVSGPDLALSQLSAAASAQSGASIAVEFAVTNTGTADATASWNDQIFLSSSSNSVVGATALATLPATSPLSSGAGYTRSQMVTLPGPGTLQPGFYYIIALADAGDAQTETSKTNNLAARSITISAPPLPDLLAGSVNTPGSATAGESISLTWGVTNIGEASANGVWQETVYLLTNTVDLAQFATNLDACPLLGTFTLTNNLAPGGSLVRTQSVTIPLTGLAGNLRIAVLVDSANNLVEQNETNNAAISSA
ncbi:MAG TPA: CARDB domain-containing protein, partial [Verrucomicrobiae bacterium]|nr:CARDB domain-containing protein [Verrucomicrobiae bacterium]